MKTKHFLLAAVFALVAGHAFAFDATSFPSEIQPGNVLVSPTFNLGFFSVSGSTLGITAAADYALPVPIMLGIETGFATITEKYTPTMIPIFARVSWHPNFEVDGLDPYLRLKLGYNIGFGDLIPDVATWGGGFSYGFQAGVRYFFNDFMGVFGELGYDYLGVSVKWDDPYWGGYGDGFAGYAYTFLHVGVTFKFGGSDGSTSSAPQTRSQTNAERYMLVNINSLNVRSGPSGNTALVGQLARNTRVQVIDMSGQWWKIRSGKIEGYVNSSFLAEEN